MRVAISWLLFAAVAPAWGSDLPAFPFINVTGNAIKDVSPDLARVSFTVTARDPAAEVAARRVSDRVAEVLELLSRDGVAQADIDAHEVGKRVVFERESGVSAGGRRGPPRYQVSRNFSVLLRNVASWPEIGSKLLEMQNVVSVEAQFDRTDRSALEAELVAAAAKDAQQRAEHLAAGFGQRLGAVQAISQDPFPEISVRLLRADMRNAYEGSVMLASAEPSERSASRVLVPPTIPLVASVNAIYRLEGAPH
jgi:uncharacterized protein YggE